MKIQQLHSFFFAFDGPFPESLNWNAVLKHCLDRVGYVWESESTPSANGAMSNCSSQIFDDQMYAWAEAKFGYDPRIGPTTATDSYQALIISFSNDSVLGSGRLLVCFDQQPLQPLSIPLIEIKPGKFNMGHGTDARPTEITKGFLLGVTPVTQKQWETVMKTRPWNRECTDCDDYPATGIIWGNAVAFCKTLSEMRRGSYRLPTEAEWEYACRAGSDTMFCFGDDELRLSEFGWYGRSEPDFKKMMEPRPVAQKKPNAWGLYDMHGNVWEWCADLCAPPPGTIAFARDPSPRDRVLRGGSWKDRAEKCCSAYRQGGVPDYKDPWTGFRVCKDLA